MPIERSNRSRYPSSSEAGEYSGQQIDTITTSSTPSTETSFTLRAGVGFFEIRTLTKGATVKLAYVATESGTNYIKLNQGAYIRREHLSKSAGAITIYIQSTKSDVVVTLESWL